MELGIWEKVEADGSTRSLLMSQAEPGTRREGERGEQSKIGG